MYDQTTRINALIAYLFVWPIMLLARSGTPLGEPYVQAHARRASLIIIIWLATLGVYFFLRSYLTFSILGISLSTIVLAGIMSVFLATLAIGAYKAFHGNDAQENSLRSTFSMPVTDIMEGNYTDEDKIRIIASFLPFIGIIIADKFPSPETKMGRKMGNFFTVLLITGIVFSGGTTTLSFVILLAYIAMVVVTAVYLFGYGRLIMPGGYQFVPTYTQIDASIKAAIASAWEFFRVAFGGTKIATYRERYDIYLAANTLERKPTISLFVPSWIIAIPGLNLLTSVSLWKSEHREWHPLILQWIFLTTLSVIITWRYGLSSQIWLYLLFPIITLIVNASKNTLIRAPITSLASDMASIFAHGKSTVEKIKQKEETTKFSYEVEKKL